MPSLYVRNVPAPLYSKLKKMARSQHLSLSVVVVQLLEDTVREEKRRKTQAKLLAKIAGLRNSYVPPPNAPSSVELLRENRAR